MAGLLILSHSPRARYLTGALMYFAQGIPQGLLSIAIPAWLASRGVGAGEIATYLAVIILPWAFKLLAGPFIDRFQYPVMGLRRPWVLGAQLGLSVSLLALALVEDPAGQVGRLMLIGVLINSFAATQDVAVDAMSIDLTPVNEQGRLNAFMSFGKAAGWGVTAALSGVLLMNFGLGVTAVVAASAAGLITLVFALVRERPGERRLPWTAGAAVARRGASDSFGAVFTGLRRVLWTRTSLIVIGVMVFDGLVSGYGHALMPIAAVKVFGYTTSQWSSLVAVMGLTGAGVALALGPLIDRFGPKRVLVLAASLVGLHALVLAQTQFIWQDSLYVRLMLSLWVLMVPVVMVCVIALGMAVCQAGNSATQFAIYMSCANLGHAGGSKLFGLVAEQSSYGFSYRLMAVMALVMVAVLLLYRHRSADSPGPARAPPAWHVASGGARGGVFFSGAMRCPKCRADMEVVEVGGVEVDRCSRCQGLWFDAGEQEALASQELAQALDTGNARQGRRLDAIDHYRCPRCGGEVVRETDPQQVHIGFERCQDCAGTFFDAGEFRDLAQHTLGDYFRDFLARHRGR